MIFWLLKYPVARKMLRELGARKRTKAYLCPRGDGLLTLLNLVREGLVETVGKGNQTRYRLTVYGKEELAKLSLAE